MIGEQKRPNPCNAFNCFIEMKKDLSGFIGNFDVSAYLPASVTKTVGRSVFHV